MENNTEGRFTPFPYFRKLNAPVDEENTYLVYSSATACKRVQASSASQAMKIAGIEKPLKILRHDPMSMTVLPHAKFE